MSEFCDGPRPLPSWAVLSLAIALGAVLRISLLGESLWYDEIAAFLTYGCHGPAFALSTYFTPSNHVLHTAVQSVAVEALGANELTLRLPAVACGLGLIPACWWLAREMGLGRAAVAASAFAAAFLPVAVLESADARGYSMAALFATLALALVARARRTGSIPSLVGLALFAALAAWAHGVAVFLGLAVAIGFGWRAARGPAEARKRALALAAAGAGSLALAVAFHAPILPGLLSIRREFLALDGDEPRLLSREGLAILLGLGGAWTPLAGSVGLALCVLGVARGEVRDRTPWGLALGAVALAIAGTALAGSWLYARFLLFALGASAVGVGAGVGVLIAWRRRLGFVIAVIATGIFVFTLRDMGPRQQLREAVKFIADHRRPGDRAVALGLADDVHRWYASAFELPMPGSGPLGSDLPATLENSPTWILVLYPHATLPSRSDLLAARGYRPHALFPGWMDWGRGEIQVWRRAAAAPRSGGN